MHKMMVLAKAVSGRRDELAQWYDSTHLKDLLAVPGVVSVERHTIVPIKRPADIAEWDFMMVYEFEGDDPMVVLRNMAIANVPIECAALDSKMTMSLVGTSQLRLDE